jgi:hypothetical protein
MTNVKWANDIHVNVGPRLTRESSRAVRPARAVQVGVVEARGYVQPREPGERA